MPTSPSAKMFSYCATIALATPPRRLSVPGSAQDSAVEQPGDTSSPPCPATKADPDTPPVLKHAIRLYGSEIGPVTPLIEAELQGLAAQYADPSEWDTAFREAVRAGVHKLRYVHKVLASRAARAASNLPLPGGTNVERDTATAQSRRERKDTSRHAASPLRCPGPTDEGLRAAQERAAAMQPLDLEATLGTADA